MPSRRRRCSPPRQLVALLWLPPLLLLATPAGCSPAATSASGLASGRPLGLLSAARRALARRAGVPSPAEAPLAAVRRLAAGAAGAASSEPSTIGS